MPEFVTNTIQLHIAAKVKDEYKFLVLQRSDDVVIYPGLWQVVTGTMEGNETAFQAAMREIKEETGLVPLKVWTVPFVAVFFDAGIDQIHASPVFGALVDYTDEIKLSSEHQKYLWLDYNECIEKVELPSHKEGTRVFFEFILSRQSSVVSRKLLIGNG